MGKRRNVCARWTLLFIAHCTIVDLTSAVADDTASNTPAATTPNTATAPSSSINRAKVKVVNDATEDPYEFAVESKKNDINPTSKVDVNDENIEYEPLIRKLDISELPKAYRHPYLGMKGYRPNTIAASAGGRTPGYGAFADYSFNRLSVGVGASYRPVNGFTVDKNDPNPPFGKTFVNLWLNYNLIPYNVSPFILAGMEWAKNTPRTFEAIAALGIEARFWGGWTLFVEYARHETERAGFPGAALGYAF